MIPKTKLEREAAITWLQNLNYHMRIAAKELRSVPPLGGCYIEAMEHIKSTAAKIGEHTGDPKPKQVRKKTVKRTDEQTDDAS